MFTTLSQDTVILGLSLAIFTIGLQFIPIQFFFRAFQHRNPTKEELLMIRKILGIIALLAFVMIIIWLPITIIDLAKAYSNFVVPNPNTSESLLVKNILFGEGILFLFLVLYLLWLNIWKTSKKINIEKTDTELLIDKIDKLLEQRKGDNEIVNDIAKANMQIKEYFKNCQDKGK